MFDSIAIGTSGLLNHAKGLRVVGNNLANVNTPGFKSSQLQFANLFNEGGSSSGQSAQSGDLSSTGAGLTSLGSQINFRAGLEQGTGNPLDLLINGNGFFVIQRDEQFLYTRSGDFRFDDKGVLVNSTGDKVMSKDATGRLVAITLDDLARNAPKATTTVTFGGTLSAERPTQPVDVTVDSIPVLDPAGVELKVKVTLRPTGATTYQVTVRHNESVVGSGTVDFDKNAPAPASQIVSLNFAPAGSQAFDLKLDFSQGVSMTGTASLLNFVKQDGYAAGVRTDQTIDAEGFVVAQFSNGQTSKGQRVVLADFATEGDLQEVGGSAFSARANVLPQYGFSGADTFGKLTPGRREGSNVDLAEEFGNLILMQRGYQASSHVISTANDMIQQLFDMKGR